MGSSRELKNRKADPTHPATTSHPVVIADGPPVALGATTWLLGTRFVGAWVLGERFVGAGLRAPEAGLFVAIPSRYRPPWRVAGNETHVANVVAIEKNKKRILIGQDASFMWLLNRLSPDLAARTIYQGMKDLLP